MVSNKPESSDADGAASLEVEVFRAGEYGAKGTYGPEDLEAMVADYDPLMHEAPVTLDHQQSGPAFGWVGSLRRQGDRLLAQLHSLSDELVGLIRKGSYKKRSIELYRQFPRTGRPYLRAVTFLGACPPEVKGLADPIFADGGPTERIWFQADGVASDETVSLDGGQAAAPEDSMAAKLRELQAEKNRMEIDSFCDSLRGQGRFAPAWSEMGIEAFMEQLAGAGAAVFAEGAEQIGALDWFKQFVSSLAPIIPLGEAAREGGGLASEQWRETLPRATDGVRLKPDSVVLHRRALQLLDQNGGLSYGDALRRASHEG